MPAAPRADTTGDSDNQKSEAHPPREQGRTMSKTIAAAFLLTCMAASADAQPRYYPNSDAATAKDTSFVVSAGERQNLSIGWNCFEEGPGVIVMFTKHLAGAGGTVPLEYGVPPGAPQSPIALPIIDSRKGALVPMPQVSEFTDVALSGETLLVRIQDGSSALIDAISLKGLASELTKLPCFAER